MTHAGRASAALLAVAVGAGTIADRPAASPPITLGGYRVLAADFHLHSSMWSDGALTPWGLVLEARRQALDAIAVTGHNETWDSRVARWFSGGAGGPIVLTGQEIHTLGHHVIAVGITRVVPFLDDVPAQINAIHAQGGVAIAAHPTLRFSPGFDDAAMSRLDGAEICHPLVYVDARFQREFELFAARAPLAAIGSSDFHGLGRMGQCRTYVFAREATPEGVLEALRAHRTVVYGLDGQAYGDAALAQLAESEPRLREAATTDRPASALDWISRVFGIAGLLALALGESRRAGRASSVL